MKDSLKRVSIAKDLKARFEDPRSLLKIKALIVEYYKGRSAEDTENGHETMLRDAFNWFVEKMIEKDQYLAVSARALEHIEEQYSAFTGKLNAYFRAGGAAHERLDDLIIEHRNRLCAIIEPYVKDHDKEMVVPCSQYSVKLQIDVLRLGHIEGPVLDIGCGEKGTLVRHLRNRGLEAQGIDQFLHEEEYLSKANWLEYTYGKDKWMTIISHMAFSNHFVRNHLMRDGMYGQYASKYMEILRSLKVGGRFSYCPSLPFVEQYLPPGIYEMAQYVNVPGEAALNTSIVRRLR